MMHNNIIDGKQTGKNFKEVREKNDMTIHQMSVVMKGVPINLIDKVENGYFIPTLEYVFDFCEYFLISIDDVIVSKL